MGKKYTTHTISIGDHNLDAPVMVQINALIAEGLHSEAGYLTEESGTTRLTDAEIAAMGYIKTYTDTDTNTQLSQAQVGAYAVDEGFIKEYTDTNTQLTSAEIAAMGYTSNTGTLTSSNDRNYITDSRGSQRAPSYYNDRYAQWDFQSTNDTLAGGDSWHGLLTVAKWGNFHASHRQEQLIFTGDDLKRRTAASDSAWGSVKTIYDSGNLTLGTLGYTGATNANYITNNSQLSNGAGYITDGNTNWNNTYNFVTSSGNTIIGTDADINTSGATIIDNLYMTDGVITSHGTRVLSLGDLGYTGATNANYITNNNQLTNGASYLTTAGKAADSNLLDGINSTSFLRSDAGDSFSGTLVGSAQRMMEPNDYGKGVYGKYSSTKFQHVWGMGSSWHLNSSGSSLGNFYGIAYTHTNVGAGSQSGFSHQTLFVENGSVKTWIGQGVRTVGDLMSDASVKAPIFYDSNDTGYYLNPASTSRLNGLTVNGSLDMTDDSISIDNQKGFSNSGAWTRNQTPHGYIDFGPANTGHAHIYTDRSNFYFNKMIQVLGGSQLNQNDIRSKMFYDIDNTGYYLNPASTSSLNIVQAVQFQGSLAGTASNANTLDSFSSESFLRSDADDTVNAGVTYTWTRTDTAGIVFVNNTYNTQLAMGGWTTANSSNVSRIRTSSGNLHMDSASNGAMYLNWYSGGDVKTNSILQSDASLRAPIFYDSNDTNYYGNFASNSRYNTAQGNYLGLGTAANTSGGYKLNMGGSVDMNANSIDYISQLHFNDNVRFYDDGNDSYLNFKYGDTDVGGIIFQNGSGVQKGFLYASNSGFGLLDSDGSWAVKTQTGTNPLELRCDNNVEFQVYNSYTNSPGSSRAPIFYDTNNTSYYVDAGSTTQLNHLSVNSTFKSRNFAAGSMGYILENRSAGGATFRFDGDTFIFYGGGGVGNVFEMNQNGNSTARTSLRAPIFYDSNNTGYYLNPASTSNLNVLTLAGTATASNFILSSDERKKTKIKDLPRNNINTNWKSFEMKNDEGEYRTGVIAQELEETHPEFVNTDPEGFKSVKYIDLLIAKIAELEARLEKLEK